MARKRSAPPSLFPLEAEVMEEMWRSGEAPVRAVMEALNAKRRKPRAYTTYMTILARLNRKGVLSRRRVGQSNFYKPRLDRESFMTQRAEAEVDALLAEFGDVALANFAKRVGQLDAERLRKLERLASGD
jgi:predicted transcriptional regulator